MLHRPSSRRRAIAVAIVGILAGCNFYNPSGTGSYPKDDPDALVDLGQRAMQDRNFTEAYIDFSRALALDSSKSLAYQGLAKAMLGKDGFSISKLVRLADSISGVPDSAKLDVLLGLGDTGLTNLYRPLMRVAHIYDLLRHRDSSGHTDGVFPAHLVDSEYTTIMANRAYFLVVDANRDTIIQSGEIAGLKLMSLASSTNAGNLKLNAEELAKQGAIDSTTGAIPDSTRDNINGILNNVANIVQDTSLLNKLVSSAQGADTSNKSINESAKDFIQQLGSSTSFFLINDSLDNDGDGCINEEIFGDSTDNDGDSLMEEDARVGLSRGKPVVGSMALLTPPDGFLHDRFRIDANGNLALVSGNDELAALTWSSASGQLSLYKDLRWVRWDDASVGNDTVWTRVCAENKTTPEKAHELATYKEIRTLAIIEIRKKVLAQPPTRARVELGRKLVGGCWDNVQ